MFQFTPVCWWRSLYSWQCWLYGGCGGHMWLPFQTQRLILEGKVIDTFIGSLWLDHTLMRFSALMSWSLVKNALKAIQLLTLIFLCHPPVFRNTGENGGKCAQNLTVRRDSPYSVLKLVGSSPSIPLNQGKSSFTEALMTEGWATWEGRSNRHRSRYQKWSRSSDWLRTYHSLSVRHAFSYIPPWIVLPCITASWIVILLSGILVVIHYAWFRSFAVTSQNLPCAFHSARIPAPPS